MLPEEKKQMLLTDLCARLPHGVKIVIQDTFKYSTVPCEYHVLDSSNFSDIFYFNNYKKFDKCMKKAMRERPNDIVIKPYLFPISSMTEEQKNECFKGTPLEIDKYGNIAVKDDLFGGSQYTDLGIYLEVINWLLKNHFDIYGLIPMELANDATGLNIY